MKKFILSIVVVFLGLAGAARAAEGGIAWDKFPAEKLTDVAALQNGAKLFVNYCLNCHAAAYMRYNRLGDIGLSEQQIKDNLLFSGEKVGDMMKVSLDAKQAKEWFGAVPPDLTVIARSRAAAGKGTGADYLYTYLRTYYRDGTKATGWNNLAFPSVGMPHVLWELQGARELTTEAVVPVQDEKGKTVGWKEVVAKHGTDGSLTEAVKELTNYHGHGSFTYKFTEADAARAARYDSEVADLVAFLTWMGDPSQHTRVKIGTWVLLFLALFTVIAWRLNAAYWKDVK